MLSATFLVAAPDTAAHATRLLLPLEAEEGEEELLLPPVEVAEDQMGLCA